MRCWSLQRHESIEEKYLMHRHSSRKLNKILASFLGIIFSLSFAVLMHAQVTGATLSGTVSDSSGGIITTAEISVRNVATDISRSVSVDTAGFYTIPNLPPG